MNSNSQPWHSLSNEQVLAALESNSSGLSSATADQRLAEYGPSTSLAKGSWPSAPLWRAISQYIDLRFITGLCSHGAVGLLARRQCYFRRGTGQRPNWLYLGG